MNYSLKTRDKAFKINILKNNRVKKKKNLRNNSEHINILIIGIPEREERNKKGRKFI